MSNHTSHRRAHAMSEHKIEATIKRHTTCNHPAKKWYYMGYVAYLRCLVCGQVLKEEER
jgi:hypothetical protein